MKISVIITTYNRPDALKKVLDGLLSQTRLPDEVIVADDGSESATRSMLIPYLDQTGIQVRHLWQEDKGFRAARVRNMAIAEARTDYLILLDGDCIPERHFVQDHLDLSQKGFFFQGKRVIVNPGAETGFDHQTGNSKIALIGQALRRKLSNRHHIFRVPFFPSYSVSGLSGVRSCNMGLFRDDIRAVNGFNHDFQGWGREDSELVVRLFKYGLKRKENPFRAICFHLWHQENERSALDRNDQLLSAAGDAESFYCRSGLNEFE